MPWVVIDFPGFHWQLAKRAHAEGIPVYYFVPPQLWAWAGWRVEKMKKWFKLVLSALPFEDKWYREHGMKSVYIGHPYFNEQELAAKKLDTAFIAEQRGQAGRRSSPFFPGRAARSDSQLAGHVEGRGAHSRQTARHALSHRQLQRLPGRSCRAES